MQWTGRYNTIKGVKSAVKKGGKCSQFAAKKILPSAFILIGKTISTWRLSKVSVDHKTGKGSAFAITPASGRGQPPLVG